MKTPSRILEFKKGCEPKGKTKEFTEPVVLRFLPSAYRVVRADELEHWQQEVKERLGLVFDVGEASVATVTFCERGGSGAADRCDSDIESGSDATNENDTGRLRRWDAKPVVLHFPPSAYEVVEADDLREWEAELARRFDIDININIDHNRVATWSYCLGPQGEAYPCDSDVA